MPMSNFKSISNELSGMTPGFTADAEESKEGYTYMLKCLLQ